MHEVSTALPAVRATWGVAGPQEERNVDPVAVWNEEEDASQDVDCTARCKGKQSGFKRVNPTSLPI